MRNFTFFTILLSILCFGSLSLQTQAQTGILNPDDPIVIYNPASPPATPAYGTLAKWVKTNRLGFNTESFKSYYYKGMAFRLKFPKSYKDSINTGKKYPVFVFFHGIGEKGTIYDNEYQLYHGGQLFLDAADAGKFDGFIMYPQTTSGSGAFNSSHYQAVSELIQNYLVPQAKADINRVIVDGLSGGGSSSWHMLNEYTKLVAACLPISASSVTFGDASKVNAQKYTPIWLFQGGLDAAPTPFTSKQVVGKFTDVGGNIKYTEYPNQGHGCWYSAWGEPDFFPFINRAHKANPWPLSGRTEFCPGDPINITMGVTAGFDGYEWRKDGNLISGATANSYTATTIGRYDCRIKRGTEWSVWSPIPVEIKLKGATVSPDITIDGEMSPIIPSPAGNTSITLKVPGGYATYNWQKEGSGTVLSTSNTVSVSTPGKYKVRVTEQYGCSSDFSNLFSVIGADGSNPPPAVVTTAATVLSKTAIKLDWTQVASPAINETGFEIYVSGNAGGPYKLIATTVADITTYTQGGLNPNTPYYYKIRAINATAASVATNAFGGTTLADISVPSAPGNLRTSTTTRNSVSLIWDESTDDVGVVKYDVYVNGIKYYETDQTQFSVFNLTHGQTYTFRVKARDFAGNASAFSNQASAQALLNGLTYKYYTFTGTWNNLPDFNTLEPVATGQVPNVTLENRTQSDNFAYLWEGFITIPTTGSYTFRTNSDDGSKLYLSAYSFGATALVNNDGLHGGQDRDGTITLTAGTYPIAITFYEQGGGEVMNVSWKVPGSSGFVPIPNSAFSDAAVVDGLPPAAPVNLVALTQSSSSIKLTWEDESNNEDGFEIWRSSNLNNGFSIVTTVAANSTSFTDNGLDASTKYFYRINAINQYGESASNSAGGNGINYAYYEQTGLNVLPNFDLLTPVKTGITDMVKLGMQNRSDDFQLKFSGYINITNPGTYTFYTSSDDGSNLYINGMNLSGKVVDNDGLHGAVEKSGTINLAAGLYPIYVTFFELGGGEVLTASISGPGLAKQQIPASMLMLNPGVSATTAALPAKPFAPHSLVADGISNSSVQVSWNYNPVAIVNDTIPASSNKIEAESYLNMQGVQKEACAEGGEDIGYIDAGDWMDYTVNVPVSGQYTVNFRVASPQSNSNQIQLRNSAGTVLTMASVPNTGNWQTWTTVAGTANLTAGLQTLRVHANVGGFNFNWFEIATAGGIVTSSDTAYASSFELYRSINDTSSFELLKTVSSDIYNYLDSSLVENTAYYYKVKALNASGASAFSNSDSATTGNSRPVINSIVDQVLRYGSTTELIVSATDGEGQGALSFQFQNLPAFGVFTSTGNGTGKITFTPALSDVGNYSDIKVIVLDENNGSDTTVFSITVNANYLPKIASVSNITLNELASAQFNITATDQNESDSLIWTIRGLPTSAVVSIVNRTVSVNLTAGYSDNGVYNVTAKVNDGQEGEDSIGFVITINDVNPNKTISVNFGDATYTAPSPWNNTAKTPVANDNFPNLIDANGVTTNISLRLLTAWSGINNQGSNTGNNSGVYPDAVIRSSYYTNASRTVRLSGLSTSDKYSLTFMGSRANPTVAVVTNYTIGSQTLPLNTANNSQNTVTFNNIQAQPDGTITFAVANAAGSTYGYLNALVLKSIYDDGSLPVAPRNIVAENNASTGKVKLTWTDAAYNETAYEVYRSNSLNGAYTLLNPGGNNANLTQLEDVSVAANNTYYYTIRTINAIGVSPYSDTVSITTSNVNPVLQSIGDVTMATQQSATVNISATDPGDIITLNASGLPSFASFTDNGNGTGVISINSGSFSGVYPNITVTATDNHGGSSSRTFTLTVNVANLTRVLVNFNQTFPVALPWNSTNAAPTANFALNNLKDQTNASTGINLVLMDAWTAHNTLGVVTGNNGGVYPDDVMRTFYYYSGTAERRVKISGLSQLKKYDFTFFASRGAYATPLETRYTIGTESVQLNATNNSTQTVKIEGVSPDANGEIIIRAIKINGSANAYLGSLVIDAYDNVIENPLPPTNLVATGVAKDQIKLVWGKTVGATGYEVWRSNSALGSYSKIADLGASAITYTNNGLAASTIYYYKVRAIANSNPTGYSNYAGASTVSYSINLNLNDGTVNAPAQPGNWNNTNALVSNGFVLPNMINDQGLNTGINFQVVTNFSGFNYLGATTGNNSGVYPDNVIKNFYYLNYADTARLKITGLTLAHTYNFVFFGSRVNPSVGVTTAYKIGSQIVTLDASNNTANTVRISGVKPDADGTVSITLYGTLAGGFGYLNAMTIEGSPGVAPDPSMVSAQSNARIAEISNQVSLVDVASNNADLVKSSVDAFPNPFVDELVVRLNLSENVNKFTILVFDISGRIVYKKQIDAANKGQNLFQLPLNSALKRGIYLIQVLGLPGQAPGTFKVVKQ